MGDESPVALIKFGFLKISGSTFVFLVVIPAAKILLFRFINLIRKRRPSRGVFAHPWLAIYFRIVSVEASPMLAAKYPSDHNVRSAQ